MTGELSSTKKAKRSITLSFATVTLIFVIILAGFGWSIYDSRQNAARDNRLLEATSSLSKETARLTAENAQRIKDIQVSRASSCRKTYSGIQDVVRSFIPEKIRSEAQKENLREFNRTIKKLQRGCKKQTKPKSTKKDGQ